MSQSVEIIDVTPRDGIQNEDKILDTDAKLKMVDYAIKAGASRIEVTSFVNPKRVPQMADADAVCERLPDNPDCQYIGLALNRRGFERATAAGLDEVNYVVVASETFSQRNQATDTYSGIKDFNDLASEARSAGTKARVGVTIAAAFGCPFEGEMPLERLLDVVKGCMAAEPFELAIADTIGVATPTDIRQRIDAIKQLYPDIPLRLHLHNTRNTGIANAWAAVEAGVAALDSSFGGVGGCPFAPRATGNIATEDLVYMLERSGVNTGVDLDVSIEAAEFVEQSLEKTIPGMVMKAGKFPVNNAAA